MNCLSMVRFSIILNGHPRGLFSPSRGIRQGDPLSPYLFLLCAEGLSILLQNATNMGHIAGISFGNNCPHISHLLFADDSLIFLRSLESECLVLKDILMRYGKASGQCINLSKSALLFSPNVHRERQQYLQTILNVRLVTNLGSYLGLPSCFSRRKGLDWQFLKDKIWKSMQG